MKQHKIIYNNQPKFSLSGEGLWKNNNEEFETIEEVQKVIDAAEKIHLENTILILDNVERRKLQIQSKKHRIKYGNQKSVTLITSNEKYYPANPAFDSKEEAQNIIDNATEIIIENRPKQSIQSHKINLRIEFDY